MNPVHRALERVAAYFAPRETRQAVVARQLLGMSRQEDARLTQALIRQRRARVRGDGSIAGDLVQTAWFVWELLDLGVEAETPTVHKAVGWLLSRQDREG